jgi:hypothetical protein
MASYKIQLVVINPMQLDGSGVSESVMFQFDPATLDQTKWNSAFPEVQTMLATLEARSTPNEPPVW